MDRVTDDLERMIKALESLSNQPATLGEQIDGLLDQLFQQKIDLMGAALNAESPVYQKAARYTGAAATKVEGAATDPSMANAVVPSVEEAIGRIRKLLDAM
jgi:hypothetical protein